MKVEDGAEDPREYPCLLRVSDGGKVKFSTKVCLCHGSCWAINLSAAVCHVRSNLHNCKIFIKLTELYSNLP